MTEEAKDDVTLKIERQPKDLLVMTKDGNVKVNCSSEQEFMELIGDLLTRINNLVAMNKALQEQLAEAAAEQEEGFKDDSD